MFQLWMRILAPYYRWRTKKETLKKMRIRSREELLDKKKQLEDKGLVAERLGLKNDAEKYKQYLEVLKWVLYEKNNT